MGKLSTTRIVGIAAETFGGMGVELTAGAELGTVIVTRQSGVALNGNGAFASNSSIKRNWTIVPTVQPATADRNLTVKWPSQEDNSMNMNKIRLYKRQSLVAPWVGNFNQGFQNVSSTNPRSTVWTGISSFSQFTASDTLNPLPIELLSFDAQPVGNTVLVNWTTASEINNDFFTVERSADAINYNAIGTVDGAGNSNSSRNYQFIDAQPLQGVSYYRLRQTDFNGTTEVFDPAVVNFNVATAQGVSLFPNPAVDYAHVMIQSVAQGTGSIRITDLSGRLVSMQNVTIDSGVQPFTIDTRKLGMGHYVISVTMADGQTYTLPLIKN
jgi:hypothetical protein